jgi:ribosomal subunit interface protein
MQTNIKATDLTLTPELREHIDKVCQALEKFADARPDALICDVEVARTTEHHLQGRIFRAEVNVSADGAFFRAEAEAETINAALDEVRDEIKQALVHSKHKKQSITRRTGAKLKELLRFGKR